MKITRSLQRDTIDALSLYAIHQGYIHVCIWENSGYYGPLKKKHIHIFHFRFELFKNYTERLFERILTCNK